jgi:hypothetical protein
MAVFNLDAETMRLVARERQEQLRLEAQRARREAVAGGEQARRARVRFARLRRGERQVANA